jgi:predicted AlkP superfamily phosphohydrolase/phosphomutase
VRTTTTRRWWVAPAALALALTGASSQAGENRQVILVSWDAGADWVVDRLLAEGRLPTVARMASEGVRAAHVLAAFPSKTAVGHAALLTGCWADLNGISGNSVPLLPRAGHRMTETASGFASTSLRAEPLYISAARAGRRVVVLSATQVHPVETHVAALRAAGVPPDRLVAFSGFEHAMAPPRVLGAEGLRPASRGWRHLPRHRGPIRELAFDVAGVPFLAVLFDDPADPAPGFDSILIRQGGRGDTGPVQDVVKPRDAREDTTAWSRPFRIASRGLVGFVRFRLFGLAPDGSGVELYQRSVNGLKGTEDEAETERYLAAAGGFHDDAFLAYGRGILGPTLWEHGSGEAERRMLEITRLDFEIVRRGTHHALARWSPDLLLHYTPMTDSAGHVWMGVLDPRSPLHDPGLAARLWPFYAAVFELADAWLGDLLAAAGPDTAVVLVSDHGMEGTGKLFNPNAALEQAGLLVRTRDGEIDLARTVVAAPPGGDFYLMVNSDDWRDGIVQPGDRSAVLERARRALLSIVDPATGQPVVAAVFDPVVCPDMGIGGPTGGDLYLDLAPGYYPTPVLGSAVVQPVPSPIGFGNHGFYPHRRSMHAIFYGWGSGIARDRQIGPITQTDIVPTVARLLGIPTPPTVTGHVIGEALAP